MAEELRVYLDKIEHDAAATGNGLLHAIFAFLEDQRLDPTPVNYSFAYRVVIDPAGGLAREVARRTDGGVRLTGGEIVSMGIEIEGPALVAWQVTDPASPPMPAPEAHGPYALAHTDAVAAAADALVVETQRQVAGFASMVSAMRDETQDFGRDLAASEDALRRSTPRDSAHSAIEQLARITAGMRMRVDLAEARLAQATHEASELRQQLAAAHDDARRDPLTGLPNRRAFEEALDAGAETPCHVAICDVDHFKAVNDQHGHAVGDRVLKAIAATLERECEGHLVARYGGEEFTMLFAGIDGAAACALLERARSAVGERRYRLRESEALIEGVTLSAGIVSIAEGETIVAAVERADALLYVAKREGRNRSVGDGCQPLA